MDPITPDEAMKRADQLADEIKADTKAIDDLDSKRSERNKARAARIESLRGLQDVKGLTDRQRSYIASALTESTKPHLRTKKETK